MGNMRITLLCTLISLSDMFSKIRLNTKMQWAKNDRSVQRALPVYDNDIRESLGLRGGWGKLILSLVSKKTSA